MTTSAPALPRFPWVLVSWLSLAQLISWGSMFYAFTLFIDPMMGDLGWSKPELTAAYSLGLIALGFGAVPVGRLIDRGHGRLVMTGGSVLAAALLLLWAEVKTYAVFLILWIGLGLAMSATLYEPGFAVLARAAGPLSRRAITVMTLVAGFASTVFIPLTHVFIEAFGWRGALLALGAINLTICATIHASVIPSRNEDELDNPVAFRPSSGVTRRMLTNLTFWAFALTGVLHGALFTGFSVHLIPLLVERGFELSTAVAAFSLIGPAQVASRILIALAERGLGMRAIGHATMALAVAACALLGFVRPGTGLVAIFVMLYGASNGMMTVVRAILPIEMFGRADYGAIQGMLTAPYTLARALGPFLFGLVWAWSGSYNADVALGLALAVGALIAFAATVSTAKIEAHSG